MDKKRILTVDDSTSVRRAISQSLSEAGFEVIEAADGLDGLKKIDFSPDLILCDVNMPNCDGLEMVRRVRAMPAPVKFTPIVMLTTESHKSVREKGKEAGVTAWLTKPFETDELLHLVRRYL